MPTEEYYNQIAVLQQQLATAKQKKATSIEIDTLIQIGKLAADNRDLGLANMHFDLAAKVIRGSGVSLEELDEVLGARGLILRRMKHYPESLKVYEQAAEAARNRSETLAQARWVGKQGGIHRLMDDPASARRAYEAARDLFAKSGEQGLAGVADQEGNLGLLASDAGDIDGAEKGYRQAVEMALAANDRGLVNTWATNLGNALTRKRLYHEAWFSYSQAMEAARELGDEEGIYNTAERWSASYRDAYHWREAAETYIDAADRIPSFTAKCKLLDAALTYLPVAGAWERTVEIGDKLIQLLKDRYPDPERLGHVEEIIARARQDLSYTQSMHPTEPDGPTTLAAYVATNMKRYEKTGDADGMEQVAHLICDAGLGLMNATNEAWKQLLPESDLNIHRKVVEDAILALCQAGQAEKSLEISLRYKCLSFCLPNIEHLQRNPAPHAEAAAYLQSLQELAQAVCSLKGWTLHGIQRVSKVRAAGEMLLECGEKLRERDPILHAKLGGLIHPSDLIDAFPVVDPIALVDLFVTPSGTIMHILIRQGKGVRIISQIVQTFTTDQAVELLKVWVEHRVSQEISDRQREGLLQITKTLHNNLTCKFAQQLAHWGVTQVVFIPDSILAPLPLHLGGVCGKDVHIPGVPTEEAVVFGEFFPVEYAPCLQAAAVSQYRRRPRNLATVLSLADPRSDLPGAASVAEWLRSRLPESLRYISYCGGEATFANLARDVDKADLVILCTHGDLDLAHPNGSHLVFADKNWTLSDMLDEAALASHPAMILSACEIGTTLPGGMAASSIPGALLSAGADFVLAALWPVENISMGYVIERFLVHLSHKGYRPSAALFRAVSDLKKWSKDDAVQRCRMMLDLMAADGTADRFPERYLLLDNLAVWLEDSQEPHPFASAQLWGSLVIVGSGWHTPAGAFVGGLQMIMGVVKAITSRDAAQELILEGQFVEARQILEELLEQAEGLERVRTLDMLAEVIWRGRQPGYEQAARRDALHLLDRAEQLAQSEEDEQLLRHLHATRQKINL